MTSEPIAPCPCEGTGAFLLGQYNPPLHNMAWEEVSEMFGKFGKPFFKFPFFKFPFFKHRWWW